jgi:hypothetical protein
MAEVSLNTLKVKLEYERAVKMKLEAIELAKQMREKKEKC